MKSIIKKSTLCAVAGATVASFTMLSTAQAAPDKALDQMLESCVQHFVATSLPDYQGKVVVEKLDSTHGASPLIAGSRNYVTVSAVTRPGGTQLASATCRIGRDGSVISMKTMPLAALKKLRTESQVVAKN